MSNKSYATIEEVIAYYKLTIGLVPNDTHNKILTVCLETAKEDIDLEILGKKAKLAHIFKTLTYVCPERHVFGELFDGIALPKF